MTKIINIASVVVLLFFWVNVSGQIQPEKSEKQLFIFGKKYYLHEVKKGQTLYSISKAYEVTEHEILAENPELLNGLKIGTEIKIPDKDSKSGHSHTAGNDYIYHTVEKKQTLYFLSNKYNVSELEIIKHNPDISQGLKTGQIVKIPKQSANGSGTNAGYKLHTIQPGETLFSLSQKYAIELNDLKNENPELKTVGPRIGQIIRIPIAKKSFEDVLKVTNNNASAFVGANFDPLYVEKHGVTPCGEFKYNSNMRFKVAVLLPLFIQENLLTKNSKNFYKNSGRFYEFYQGLLLASKKLKESGLSVEFYVKDTKASTQVVKEILADPALKDMDLIIGPVYSEPFKLASAFAKENKINIVAPFKQKFEDLVVANPYIFLANPSDETEIANLCRYMADSYDRSIVYVHNGTEEELKIAETFKKQLISVFAQKNKANEIAFKQINFKTAGSPGLEDALSIGLENIVVIPSKDIVFITNLATKLNYLTGKYKITVFGMQPWEQMESVEVDYLRNLKFHYGTTNYVDRQDEKVKLFDYQYKAYFKNEASVFSYLGYDITMYFLTALKEYGPHFQFCTSPGNKRMYAEGLRMDFNFERVSPYSGFENNWFRIVKINKELQMQKVK